MPTAAEMRQKQVARWGAACAPCAAAKAKCLRTNDTPGSKCDRCQRLFKDCSSQIHRPRKKRACKPSKTSQLEERLNGLVEILRASGELPHVNRPQDLASYEAAVKDDYRTYGCIPTKQDPGSSHQGPTSRSREGSLDSDSTNSSASGDEERPFTIPATYNCYAPAACICRPESGETPPPPESDEVLLSRFRMQMSPMFPFVPIPSNATPAQLASERPFLWQTIRMAASVHSVRSMRGQLYRIMEHISEHVLMRSQRNLDLLQGIIVVLGWYHYHCMMHAQLNSLIHLAEGMLADLGLNRHPLLFERTRLLVMHPEEPKPRTNEERRALLGVWFLSSSIAIGFQKTQSMRYSAYVQHCLRELEESKEFETDMMLVRLIRIQHLAEKIVQVNTREDPAEDVPGMPRAPTSAYQSAFQNDLHKIRNSLPKSLKNNLVIITALNTVELRLYEPPILDAALINKFSQSLTLLVPGQPTALDRLYRSNAALRNWFDHWFAVSVSDYHWFPLSVCGDLIYGVTMLSRWAKLVGPVKPNHHFGGKDEAEAEAFCPTTEAATSPHRHGTVETVGTSCDASNSGGSPCGTSSNSFGPDDMGVGQHRHHHHHHVAGAPAGMLATPSPTNTTMTAMTTMTNATTPSISVTGPGSSTPAHMPIRSMLHSSTSTRASSVAPSATSELVGPLDPPQGLGSSSGSGSGSGSVLNNVQARDPDVPTAVAALKAQLLAQPGLSIDITEILAAVGVRFDQAWRQSTEMAAASCAARGGDPSVDLVLESNIWDLSAKKVMVTRAKLERWAVIVSQRAPGTGQDVVNGACDGRGQQGGGGSAGGGGDGGNGPHLETMGIPRGHEVGGGGGVERVEMPGGMGTGLGNGTSMGMGLDGNNFHLDGMAMEGVVMENDWAAGCVGITDWPGTSLWGGGDLFSGMDPNAWYDTM